MAPLQNFIPGPSQLYFTVQDHVKKALKEGIPSISHRSKQFERIFQETTEGIRELLSLPENYSIYFTGSATEIWERIVQNLVHESSLHFVNGAFSKRFYETARQYHKDAVLIEVEPGHGFDHTHIPEIETELVAVTHNETSTGVCLPTAFIDQLKEKNPAALVAVDAVSSLPYVALNYTQVDTVFFSVQKGFGLPAGLGVWLANEKCLAKAERLLTQGQAIGAYHNLLSLHDHARKNQTPETPNVLGIYLLGQVVQDMLRRGLTAIRRETDYKAAILYQLLSDHPRMHAFVQQKEYQSKTVLTIVCANEYENIYKVLEDNRIVPGEGYGSFRHDHLRIANFPAHSKEQFELLVDILNTLK